MPASIIPYRVFIEISEVCNGSCIYCRNDQDRKSNNILTTSEISGTIGDLLELGTKELVLTGGEPLLNKDIADIANFSSKKGLETLIATNGMLLNRELLSQIKQDHIRIQVSLDSMDPNINDMIRGQRSYEKAINAINLCQEYRIPLQISTTITALNLPTIQDIISYGVENQIPIKIRRLVTRGKGKNVPELVVQEDKLKQLLEDFVLNHVYKGIVAAEQIPYVHNNGHSEVYRCTAGNSILYIQSDGKVGPCPSVDAVVGNVKETPIAEIWRTKFDGFRYKNYRPFGFCGMKRILELGKKLQSIGIDNNPPTNYAKFIESGCKCTG